MTAPTAPPDISYEAKLVPFADGSEHAAVQPGSWFVTFGLGKAAGGTYTEVVLAPVVRELPERVQEEAVRRVVRDLYANAYAFIYRPDQYAESIERWDTKRRERVALLSVEVYS
jgi:hypothetical protein